MNAGCDRDLTTTETCYKHADDAAVQCDDQHDRGRRARAGARCRRALLFDPETFELTGIVDFAERGLHDPAVDFVQLFHWRGEGFVRLVLDAYAPDGDPWLLDRVRFDAVVNAGIWLAEVVDQRNEAGVASRGYQFEHIVGPTLRSMVRGGRG